MVKRFPDSVRGARCSAPRGSFRGFSGTAMLRVAVVVCGRDAFRRRRPAGDWAVAVATLCDGCVID